MARLSAPITEATMRWVKDLQFEGSGPGQPTILVDGDTKVATSPVQLLLLAAASCTASDIVIILQKQRIALESLEISVRGTRREEPPRRIMAMALHVSVRGQGADEVKVRRAIDLSIEKYCSVIASLAPDIPVTYDVTIA
jgi:putative redox protein